MTSVIPKSDNIKNSCPAGVWWTQFMPSRIRWQHCWRNTRTSRRPLRMSSSSPDTCVPSLSNTFWGTVMILCGTLSLEYPAHPVLLYLPLLISVSPACTGPPPPPPPALPFPSLPCPLPTLPFSSAIPCPTLFFLLLLLPSLLFSSPIPCSTLFLLLFLFQHSDGFCYKN